MSLESIYDSAIFIDLYELLEVDLNSTISEIKNSYLKLVKIHHPDRGGNSEIFQKITNAHDILTKSNLRKEYDLYYVKKNFDDFKNDEHEILKN